MSDEPNPFELEPEEEAPAPEPAAPAPKAAPSGASEGSASNDSGAAGRATGTYDERAAERAERRLEAGATSEDVDTRTVAERAADRAGGRTPDMAARGSEAVGPPADWPNEAFGFPLRAPGSGFLIMGVVALLPLDVMGAIGAVAFLSWLLKMLLMVFVLRAQLGVIAASAAGRDVPVGWRKALAFEGEELWPYVRTVLSFAALLAPGALTLAFGNAALGVLLIAAGSMYAAVLALGAALQDPSIKWPWNAFRWIAARPLSCLVGCAGWWVLGMTEWSLATLSDAALPMVAFLSVALRLAGFYALLVSARAIGVMGRAWGASDDDLPDAASGDAPSPSDDA